MVKKLFILFLILSICLVTLAGCYDATGIEDLSYAIAIGLDKGQDNIIKLSVQIATPSKMSGEGQSGGQSEATTITTIESSSVSSGINLINSYISKKLNLAHCEVIIISEELAKQGIDEQISNIIDNIDIRPTCNIIISKCSAINFLENAKPTLETITARYYEAAINSSEYTAYTADIDLFDFFYALKSNYIEPLAILAGVNTENTHKDPNGLNKFDIDSSYTASQTPIEDKTSLECMGLAVFRGDKLVGELDGIESICYSILANKLDNCMITIPDPLDKKETLDVYIKLQKNTETSVSLINDTPFITVKMFLDGNIASSDETDLYSAISDLNQISNSVNKYIYTQAQSFLYKTAKDFKSDVVGFGKRTMKYYLTNEEWENSNWLDNYQNAFFKVEVTSNIKSGELF